MRPGRSPAGEIAECEAAREALRDMKVEGRVASRTAGPQEQVTRRSEDALRQSEGDWREIFEHNPAMYFMVDATGTVLAVNASGASDLGYAVEELIGQSVLYLSFEEDREFVRRNIVVCLEAPGRSNSWEVRQSRKDGTVIWVRENAK